MEQVHTVKKYRGYYKEYRSNPSDKTFFEEYKNSFEENNIYSFILNKDSVSLKNVENQKAFYINVWK